MNFPVDAPSGFRQPALVTAADPSIDPVLVSVAAYTAQAADYEAAYAAKYGDIVARFAAGLPVTSRILDAGCGPGRDLARFAAHGHVVRGVELNPAFAALARRHAPTTVCDLREVATHLAGERFDGIWAAASLVHLSAPDVIDVLRQFAMLLRPDGKLFVSVRSSGETGWLDEPDGRRWYTVWPSDVLADTVGAAGFTVDDVRPGPYTELWATRGHVRSAHGAA